MATTNEEAFQKQMIFARDVLQIFWQLDIHDELFWCMDLDMPVFYVKCSDVFSWGTADLELITPENLPGLLAAFRDILSVADGIATCYCTDLFVARIRKMRPQGAAYPKDNRLWPLFDAAGPRREQGLGNPKPHPSEQ